MSDFSDDKADSRPLGPMAFSFKTIQGIFEACCFRTADKELKNLSVREIPSCLTRNLSPKHCNER